MRIGNSEGWGSETNAVNAGRNVAKSLLVVKWICQGIVMEVDAFEMCGKWELEGG